jgi:hypothetical protein
MAPSLAQLSARIQAVCRARGIDLGAMHIRGEENGLADRISRYTWDFDDADWMVVREIFAAAEDKSGRTVTLDGASDPLGTNAHVRRFCSKVDSYFDRDLSGEAIFANPDYRLILEYLSHFLKYWRLNPESTSAIFVLPVWESQAWWKLLKGSHLLFWVPRRTSLFTSPQWYEREEHNLQPRSRVCRGSTNWDVMVLFFPCVLRSRGGKAATELGGSREDDARGRTHTALFRMSGVVWKDVAMLYSMPPHKMQSL